MAASYEDQAFYIFEAIEELINDNLNTTYSIIILETKNLNKMHFEYLSDSILNFINVDGKKAKLIDINNEWFIIDTSDIIIKIDLEYDSLIKEPLFRIQKEKMI